MIDIEYQVRLQYDRLADIYDRRWSHYITNTLEFLKDWVQIPVGGTILDVACGTGEFERLILADHPQQRMIGVDLSENMLAIAQAKCDRYSHIQFQRASVESLPLSDQSVDLVVSANAFHYFRDPQTALTEMYRVVKPGGQVVILDWCRDYWVCQVCDWVLGQIDPAHSQCFTQEELHGYLTTTRLSIEQSSRYRFGLIWGLMVATAVKPTHHVSPVRSVWHSTSV